MMRWGRVSSVALRKRSVDIDGQLHRGTAIMPFFDSTGRVEFCGVVLPDTNRIYFFDPSESEPHVPLFGPVRLLRPTWNWSDGESILSMQHLWHYDPDWLLRDDRFAGMAIAAEIQKTNCCSHMPSDVQRLYFQRDLSRAQSAVRGTNENAKQVAIGKVVPPRRAEPVEASVSRSGWRLNPVWMRT